jgi:hypothetical protein
MRFGIGTGAVDDAADDNLCGIMAADTLFADSIWASTMVAVDDEHMLVVDDKEEDDDDGRGGTFAVAARILMVGLLAGILFLLWLSLLSLL